MFTVLHEHPDGSRAFYPVARPLFIPDQGGRKARLQCMTTDFHANSKSPPFVGELIGGKVILMNEAGKTVAVFEL